MPDDRATELSASQNVVTRRFLMRSMFLFPVCLLVLAIPAAAARRVARPAGPPHAAARSVPVYRIYPLKNGECVIAGNHAFRDGDPKER